MRRTTWAAATAVLATAIAGGVIAPGWADGTTAWRPDTTAPDGTGFWSNACGTPQSSAQGPDGLTADILGVAASRTFERAGDGDVRWRYTPGSGQAGISLAVPDPATTTELSVVARSATAKGVMARLLVFYRAPGAAADSYFIGTATDRADTHADALDLSSGLVWLQHRGATPLSPASWSAVFPSKPLDPSTNQPRSIRSFAASNRYQGGGMLAGYELGCTGDAFAIDHLVRTDATGTTDLDLSAQQTSTTLTSSVPQVLAGQAAHLTGAVLGAASGSQLGGSVALEAAPYGSTDFKEVGRLPAPAPVFVVRPSRTTQYRLRYLGTAAADRSTSTPVSVEVRRVVALEAAQGRVRLGSRVQLSGSVRPGLPGVPVTLQQQSGDTWVDRGHAATDGHGRYRFAPRARPGGPTAYRVLAANHAGVVGASSRSVAVTVTVPTTVSAQLGASSVRTGRTVRVSGASSAGAAGYAVRLQRLVNGHWRTLAHGTTTDGGRYAVTLDAGAPGTWTLRVVVAAHDYHLAGHSPRRTLTITPKPRPKPAPQPTPAPEPTPPPSGSGSGSGDGGGGGTGIG